MDRLTPIPRRDTSPPTLHRNVDTKSVEGILVPHLQDQAQQPPGEEDGEFLAAQIKALMMHLSELLEEKGEDSFFSAFEGRDPEDVRSLDKDGFVDAIVDFAPAITTEQALELFRVRPQGTGGNVDYDKLIKELLKISQLKNFQVGDKVQLREGWLHWVHAEVVSRGDGGTYTVRFISRVPWRGFVTEHGVSVSRLRMALRKDTSPWEEKKKSVGEFTTKVASWLSGLPKPSLSVKQTKAGHISTRLKRLIQCNKGRARANTEAHRTGISIFTKRKRHHLKDSNGVEQSTSSHNEPPKEGTDFSEEEHVHRTPRRCRSDAATTATSKIRNEAYSDIDSSRSTSDTEWANGGNVSENVTLYSPSTVRLVRSRNGRKNGSIRGKRRGGRKGTGSAKSSSRYSSMESNSALVQQRSISEFPVIREVFSPPRDKRHPSQSRQRERSLPSSPLRRSLRDQRHDPSAALGRSRTSRNGGLTVDGLVQSRNGGFESPESLRGGNMEEKFELYKKRTKEALSPENKRGFDGSDTSCRAGNRAHSNH